MTDSSPGAHHRRRLPADLNTSDDDGLPYALVELAAFDPAWLYPGALISAGTDEAHGLATVVRTELLAKTSGGTAVVVTFDLDRRPDDA